MRKLPVGIQNFSKIIEGYYLYIDKTEFIYNLINGASYYFLSRPRRFGKSLLLDTISEVFSGKKELFRGLWIYDSGYSFEKHPVIRLDMSNIANKTPEVLEESILNELTTRIEDEGLLESKKNPADMFKYLIQSLYKKYNKRVVVLIDEYDKPILDHIANVETAEANRQVIRDFYGILKSMDPYLEFTFLTGVSKFAKTSVFSELNNLKDITLSEEYANICGIAVEDLDKYFAEHINSLKTLKRFKDCSSINDEILAWYDGYSWDGVNRVINPFSLLSFFSQKRFSAFWYASGTPKFLIDLIKKNPAEYSNLKTPVMTEYMLDSADFNKLEATPLLFQSGYLTIKAVETSFDGDSYILDMPNFEVRRAFNQNIIASFTDSGHTAAENTRLDMAKAFQDGDLQKILEPLRSLFASIPYELHIDREAYYHSIFYAIMNVHGFDIDAEASVSKGRIDAVLEHGGNVYVMEFKYVKCPQNASDEKKKALFDKALNEGMGQIKARGYYKKYVGGGKNIHLAALAFLGRDDIEMKTELLQGAP